MPALHPDEIQSPMSPDHQFRESPFFSHFTAQLDEDFLSKLTGDLHATKITPDIESKLKKKFLELFARCCIAKEVAYQMRLSAGTVFKWRHEDKEFAKEMDKIRQEASIGLLEEKAMIILSGPPDPKNNILLMFMMKSYGRRMFDDKFVEINDKKQLRTVTVTRAEKVPETIEAALRPFGVKTGFEDDDGA